MSIATRETKLSLIVDMIVSIKARKDLQIIFYNKSIN